MYMYVYVITLPVPVPLPCMHALTYNVRPVATVTFVFPIYILKCDQILNTFLASSSSLKSLLYAGFVVST